MGEAECSGSIIHPSIHTNVWEPNKQSLDITCLTTLPFICFYFLLASAAARQAEEKSAGNT